MNTEVALASKEIFDATQNWVNSVVITHNFCPFAKRVYDQDSIRYSLAPEKTLEQGLQFFADELLFLDSNDTIETSLIIYAEGFEDFDNYLELLELTQKILVSVGFEGKFQLASFHPQYCFEGCSEDDVENYTNRSPYPMLHLIREDTVTQVLANYEKPENIPERNIAHARKLGKQEMQSLLANCYNTKGD